MEDRHLRLLIHHTVYRQYPFKTGKNIIIFEIDIKSEENLLNIYCTQLTVLDCTTYTDSRTTQTISAKLCRTLHKLLTIILILPITEYTRVKNSTEYSYGIGKSYE